jgi:hypothetical protein
MVGGGPAVCAELTKTALVKSLERSMMVILGFGAIKVVCVVGPRWGLMEQAIQ